MRRVLVSWVGHTDLRAAGNNDTGPITSVLEDREFDAVLLMFSGYSDDECSDYENALKDRYPADIHSLECNLDNPTDYTAIHKSVVDAMAYIAKTFGDGCELSVHVSSGTPQMHVIWVLLSSTRFPAELIQSSGESGVQSISFPYEISAELLADMARWNERKLEQLAQALPLSVPEFDDIIGLSQSLSEAKAKSFKAAKYSFPVLLEGESGTGKELFARAIHSTSMRSDGPFIAVNCGALSETLAESELFGHVKGAFTDAMRDKPGYFEQADGGTLFLDEIGELPLHLQAKLLRVLEENVVRRVGADQTIPFDVRILAATNRDLVEQIGTGSFRSDLYHRIAVLVIALPPLRNREGDIGRLMDHLLDELNDQLEAQPGFEKKELKPGARNLLIGYPWPGNVRQLRNTLMRLMVWSPGNEVTKADVQAELRSISPPTGDAVLGRPLGEGFDLHEILGEVAGHYIGRALDTTRSKRQAAISLGYNDPNTLDRRIATYEKWIGS